MASRSKEILIQPFDLKKVTGNQKGGVYSPDGYILLSKDVDFRVSHCGSQERIKGDMVRNKNTASRNERPQDVYGRIHKIIENARANITRVVNTEMVTAYWHIGGEIVEEEQKGRSRAAYGQKLLEKLALRLCGDFGKGFDESNLRNIRSFYITYPKRDALRHELSWTHYRILTRNLQ